MLSLAMAPWMNLPRRKPSKKKAQSHSQTVPTLPLLKGLREAVNSAVQSSRGKSGSSGFLFPNEK